MPMSCDNRGVNSLQVSSKTLPYTSLRGEKKKKKKLFKIRRTVSFGFVVSKIIL